MVVDDYELARDFIMIRSNRRFFKYSIESKTFEMFEDSIRINEFDLIACGHSFMLGVKLKQRRLKSSRKTSRNRSLVKSSNKH